MSSSHKVEPAKVKAGELMAFIYYGRVVGADSTRNVWPPLLEHRLKVKGLAGAPENFDVNGNRMIEASFSADQYAEEKKVTQTEAAETLTKAYNRPFTVVFRKASGERRTLRGRLVHPEPLLGRSQVEDLDVEHGSPLRLVDHRTVESLVVGGVKYVVK